MNHDKKLFLTYSLMIAGLLFFLPSLVNAFPTLEFDGDTVFINDSNAYLSATPHTVQGIQPVELEVLSKQFTGNVNVLFGYNGEYLKPFRLEYYNPHEVCNTINNTDYCHIEEWTVLTSSQAGFTHVNYELDGKTDWYYRSNFPIIAGNTYKIRVWIEAPYLTFGKSQEEQYPDYDGKYDFAIYPSSYGSNIAQANNNGHLYLLDPVVDLTTGLEAYYPFDFNASDVVNSYDGSVTGATLTTGTGGINNEAYSFDGNNDYIALDSNLFGSSETDISISFWFKTTSTNYRDRFLGMEDTGTDDNYEVSLWDDGTVLFRSQTTNGNNPDLESTTTGFNDGNYHHVVIVKDSGGTNLLYVDGSLEDSDTDVGGTTDLSWGSFYVGARNTGGLDKPINAIIDELAIYTVPLNTTHILELWNSGSGKFFPFGDMISDPFIITAVNGYNGTSLNIFNATVDGDFYTTTNGTIVTTLLQNSTILHNITIEATNYFDITTIG